MTDFLSEKWKVYRVITGSTGGVAYRSMLSRTVGELR